MKNRVFFFAFALLLFSACDKENSLVQDASLEQALTTDPEVTTRADFSTTASGSERVMLQINQTTALSSGMKVTLVSISDTRCPANTFCSSPGNAVVGLAFQSTDSMAGLKLGISKTDPDFSTTGVVFDKFMVTLLDVSPFPQTTAGIPQDNFRVTIGVQPR
ncbi:MAG: hypothetical protein AAB316_20650 [Bacteroidota bacterium]